MELEHILKIAEVVENVESDIISVGSAIELKKDDKQMLVKLAGATEADPANGKISLDSPLGQMLLGRKQGEEFDLTTPGGKSHYVVVKVN